MRYYQQFYTWHTTSDKHSVQLGQNWLMDLWSRGCVAPIPTSMLVCS